MFDDVRPANISPELQAYIESITSKRPRTFLNHILKYGSITTKDLDEIYGYKHAPRAAKDVEDNGIKLNKRRIKINGKSMTEYTLAEQQDIEGRISGGRRAFPKKLKTALISRQGEECALCKRKLPANILQIDHRIPYEVAFDKGDEFGPENFMLLCGSCNRAKSWTCERSCENWQTIKDGGICKSCIFGSPNDYTHIAMEQRRRATLEWVGEEVRDYDNLKEEAAKLHQDIQAHIKSILEFRKPSK